MRFETSQHQRLEQQMKLSPRMIQSMAILQMPMMMLQERIEQELESNIALEQVDASGEDSPAPEGELPVEESERGSGDEKDDWERASILERYREEFGSEYGSARMRNTGERDRKMDAMANIAAPGDNLEGQLLQQWTFAEVTREMAATGRIVLGYIDADGILSADAGTILEQNAKVDGHVLTTEGIEEAIDAIQRCMEPAGIGARNKRECFLLQVDALAAADVEKGNDWPLVRLLLGEHFEDLVENRLPRIAQVTELSLESIQAAKVLMKRITMSPGRDLFDEIVPPMIADVVIEFDSEGGEYTARIEGTFLPTLAVSENYVALAKDASQEKETREYAGRSVADARWLIDAIGQRRATLMRVVQVVLVRQREFFDHGPQHLKPLPMTEVSDQLGIHVATVSRAVAGKWMQTPRGLVELRRFFSGGTSADDGRVMSWEAIKVTLKEIIDAEDKTSPLSDGALVKALQERGIKIARRTVVKYRTQLDIPPARRRKEFGDEVS